MSMQHAIEQIIEDLKRPLQDDERHAGWRKSVKEGYISVFSELLSQLRNGEDPPYFGIARSLDAYGIGGGDLYDRMLGVANELNHQLK